MDRRADDAVVGLVGYGETGRIFVEDLRARGIPFLAYDVKFDDAAGAARRGNAGSRRYRGERGRAPPGATSTTVRHDSVADLAAQRTFVHLVQYRSNCKAIS